MYWENFKFVHACLCFWIRGFKKRGYYFEFSNFPRLLENSKFCVFSKTHFFNKIYSKVVNILQSWLTSSKKYNCCDQSLRKLSMKLINLLRVLRGEITLTPPPPPTVLLRRLCPCRRYAWFILGNQLMFHDINSF